MVCVRNTMLEDIHAGIVPVTRTGDYSDVTVVDADGNRIPWTRVSHFDDDAMRDLMRQVVDRLYTFHERLDEPAFLDEIAVWIRAARRWDAPKRAGRVPVGVPNPSAAAAFRRRAFMPVTDGRDAPARSGPDGARSLPRRWPEPAAHRRAPCESAAIAWPYRGTDGKASRDLRRIQARRETIGWPAFAISGPVPIRFPTVDPAIGSTSLMKFAARSILFLGLIAGSAQASGAAGCGNATAHPRGTLQSGALAGPIGVTRLQGLTTGRHEPGQTMFAPGCDTGHASRAPSGPDGQAADGSTPSVPVKFLVRGERHEARRGHRERNWHRFHDRRWRGHPHPHRGWHGPWLGHRWYPKPHWRPRPGVFWHWHWPFAHHHRHPHPHGRRR